MNIVIICRINLIVRLNRQCLEIRVAFNYITQTKTIADNTLMLQQQQIIKYNAKNLRS